MVILKNTQIDDSFQLLLQSQKQKASSKDERCVSLTSPVIKKMNICCQFLVLQNHLLNNLDVNISAVSKIWSGQVGCSAVMNMLWFPGQIRRFCRKLLFVSLAVELWKLGTLLPSDWGLPCCFQNDSGEDPPLSSREPTIVCHKIEPLAESIRQN